MAKGKGSATAWAYAAIFVMLLLLTIWATITPEHLVKVIQTERENSVNMGGEELDRWIYAKMMTENTDTFKESAATVIRDTKILPSVIREWALDRTIVTWLWSSLISYRVHAIELYFFILFPFLIASAMDGWGVREISTHKFKFQSPLKHRMGVFLLYGSITIIMIWLIIPLPIPAIFTPLILATAGIANWTWLANLQKRI